MRLEDAAAILDRAEFFDICNAEEKRLLAFSSETRRYGADDVVCKGDEAPGGAHILISGTLKAKPEGAIEGKPYTISTPGSVISAMALILAKPRLITVTAVVDTQTLFIPRTGFKKLMEQSPTVAARAIAVIQHDLGQYVGALQPIRQKMRGER